MFKVCTAEIKKILSKPGIYILSILLAIILVLGVFVYEPKVYENTNITLEGSSFLDKYQTFVGDGISNGEKLKADTLVSDSISLVTSYNVDTINGTVSEYEYIIGKEGSTTSLKAIFDDKLKSYRNCSSNSSTESMIATERKALVASLENLNKALDDALVKSGKGSYVILTTQANRDKYKELYKGIYELFNVSTEKNKIAEVCKKYDDTYKKEFEKVLNETKFPTVSKEFVSTYTTLAENSRYSTLQKRLDNIIKDIESTKTKAEKEKIDAKEMDRLANLYINTCSSYANLIKYELLSNAFKYVSTTEQLDTIHLKEHSKYNSNSLLIRYNYLFENNKTENDFAHPLTIGVTSNYETNAYDYAYFVLRLFSFVIIVFAVMTACHSIAGEIKDGTMRYFAIRPVSRKNIFFGKLLAILTLSIILILFSGIISVCVGGAVYGFSSLKILTIFNGKFAITLHPIAMLSIYVLSMLLELIIYTAIAMLLSCLIKSDLLSVTIVLVLYLINILLPVFVNGANTWLSFYPFSHISLYSLFGSSVYAIKDNFFNTLLGAKVYASTSLPLTLVILILIPIITSAISLYKFRDKEL